MTLDARAVLCQNSAQVSISIWVFVINIPLPDASLVFYPNFIAFAESKVLANTLYEKIQWRQDQLYMYGRLIDIPRLQAWYGDAGTDYQYSNLKLNPQPWNDELLALRHVISEKSQASFNSVLANCYRDHHDSVGWHSDDEPELGPEPVIASLSLGAERYFHMKHKQSGEKFKLKLPSGSLLIMKGKTQSFWQHAVLKSRQMAPYRINLTFRKILK
ncbi:alpha-ketoglutarate-dependent dioxygenase AlkB family protein [Thalassotalea marina]|uniref:Alkylated DNA repair protein n=1 Tax=Thalassotalea marina TaxID=1673741 RepID=A0A919BFH8_9GAMM|nr:alpha-ketoglutarate-dependent dioxygenase AlkB [Thalassotalea marina]GHF85528.1 alkylated DNA repair protein [Thalassotalea marina]